MLAHSDTNTLLEQGHFYIQTGVAGDRSIGPLISQQPFLPPEPQEVESCVISATN